LLEGGRLDGSELRRWNGAGRVGEEGLLVPDEAAEQVRPIVRRSAGHDAVEVVREPLRFHQRLASAVRAADEVRARRAIAVEGSDHGLRVVGRFLESAEAEVDDFLVVSGGEGRGPADVAVVGAGRGVVAPQRGSQRPERTAPAKPPFPD